MNKLPIGSELIPHAFYRYRAFSELFAWLRQSCATTAADRAGEALEGRGLTRSISRGPLVRTAGLEPALPCEKQIFLPLRLSPPPF